MRFKELGEALHLAGADLIAYINAEVEKQEAKAERAAGREQKKAELEAEQKKVAAEREAEVR
ncbi:hypothetical protein, partial [Acinetobacter baumannii]|uniref:hypothetical protein n=1 Tax=Acinetobacter baumannii TaxID=470 RepID=UPI00339A4A98